MKNKRNVFEEARFRSNQAMKNSGVGAHQIYDQILDDCVSTLNRIAMQERTWVTTDMSLERRGEFVACLHILKQYFPGMDPADVLEVIRVE